MSLGECPYPQSAGLITECCPVRNSGSLHLLGSLPWNYPRVPALLPPSPLCLNKLPMVASVLTLGLLTHRSHPQPISVSPELRLIYPTAC